MDRYIIIDWASNHMWPDQSFETFEDAWGFIYVQFEHLNGQDFDEQMCEYEVIKQSEFKE